jgi:hypothetical protein
VNCGDIKLLETVDDVDCGLHGCVGGRLVTIGLYFHAAGDSGESFSAGEIGDVDEGVVPGCEDMADSEDITRGVLWAKCSLLFGFNSFFGSFGRLCALLGGCLGGRGRGGCGCRCGGLSLLYLSHNINLIFYK